MEKNNLIIAKNGIPGKKETYNRISSFPLSNISETKDVVHIILEIPGYSEEEITVQSLQSRLYVSGERPEKLSDKKRMRLSTERVSSFSWVYDLKMPFEKKDVSITLENGFMFLAITKSQKGLSTQTKKFDIQDYMDDNIYFPRANVVETENHIEMSLEIPGYKKDDVSINIVEASLSITGKRSMILLNKEQQYRKIEIPFLNSFLRRFELPEYINHSQASWNVQYGVLYVFLPKLKTIRKEEVARESMIA